MENSVKRMNVNKKSKKSLLWLIAGMYVCIILAMLVNLWLQNHQELWAISANTRFVTTWEELTGGLRLIMWLLTILTVCLSIMVSQIFVAIKAEIIEGNVEDLNLEIEYTDEESPNVVNESTINEKEEVEKKEILSIYLVSGESFFHEIDSMGLSSQEMIAAWRNMKPGGELIVEDSDGWSMYVMNQIAAITILYC